MIAHSYLDQNLLRLAALYGLRVIDSGSETVYDDITQLTAKLCEAPICLITLVDEKRQWFKSKVGVKFCETTIEQSICIHAVNQNSYLEIQDTQLDPRTIDNVLCKGDNSLRFYAGAVLRTLDGWPLGTLCVLDYKPRRLTKIQRSVLHVHAKTIMRHMEFTKILMERTQPISANAEERIFSQEEIEFREKTNHCFDKLTPREKEVLNLIAGKSTSLSSKQIADQLGISIRTVHHHRAHIMRKMDVTSVASLIGMCIRARIFK